MKRLFIASLSGLLYALSFPSYSLWPLAWVWAVPLLFLVRDVGKAEAFVYGMVSGMVAWGGVLYWIAYVMNTYGGMGLLPASFLLLLLLIILSLYFGAFAWLARRFIHSRIAFVLIPGAWVLLELVRSYVPFSGFPWALLGYSQFPWKPFIQVAELGGVYLVGGIVLMGNVSLYQALKRKELLPVLFTAVILTNCLLWGAWRMGNLDHPADVKPLRAAVAQANIPQDKKWMYEMVDPTIDIYSRLIRSAVRDGAEIVVCPETSCPFFLFREWAPTSRVVLLSQELGTKLVVGSPAREDGQYFNRMWLIDRGMIGGFYDKVHLVPFGEYLPLQSLIRPFFSGLTKEVGDFATARSPSPIGDIGVMICFESIFPGIARDLCNRGAVYLVNASNDAWFKTWSTPEQHLQMASFRAIESRRWLLRSVNHGISAIVDPKGRIVKELGLLKEGFLIADITPRTALTFYTRFGPLIAFLWAGLAAIAALTFYRSDVKAS